MAWPPISTYASMDQPSRHQFRESDQQSLNATHLEAKSDKFVPSDATDDEETIQVITIGCETSVTSKN